MIRANCARSMQFLPCEAAAKNLNFCRHFFCAKLVSNWSSVSLEQRQIDQNGGILQKWSVPNISRYFVDCIVVGESNEALHILGTIGTNYYRYFNLWKKFQIKIYLAQISGWILAKSCCWSSAPEIRPILNIWHCKSNKNVIVAIRVLEYTNAPVSMLRDYSCYYNIVCDTN